MDAIGECETAQDWLARPVDSGTEEDQLPNQVHMMFFHYLNVAKVSKLGWVWWGMEGSGAEKCPTQPITGCNAEAL